MTSFGFFLDIESNVDMIAAVIEHGEIGAIVESGALA